MKRKKKKPEDLQRQGLKEEVAKELGLEEKIKREGWGNLSSKETGKVGGHVAKKLRKGLDNPVPQSDPYFI